MSPPRPATFSMSRAPRRLVPIVLPCAASHTARRRPRCTLHPPKCFHAHRANVVPYPTAAHITTPSHRSRRLSQETPDGFPHLCAPRLSSGLYFPSAADAHLHGNHSQAPPNPISPLMRPSPLPFAPRVLAPDNALNQYSQSCLHRRACERVECCQVPGVRLVHHPEVGALAARPVLPLSRRMTEKRTATLHCGVEDAISPDLFQSKIAGGLLSARNLAATLTNTSCQIANQSPKYTMTRVYEEQANGDRDSRARTRRHIGGEPARTHSPSTRLPNQAALRPSSVSPIHSPPAPTFSLLADGPPHRRYLSLSDSMHHSPATTSTAYTLALSQRTPPARPACPANQLPKR